VFGRTVDSRAQGARWLALPRGTHTVTVRKPGAPPAERQISIEPGKTRVVQFKASAAENVVDGVPYGGDPREEMAKRPA
jgi:hypothetical protein